MFPIKGTKYLSELVQMNLLQKNKLNIIKAPTGSGKTYFALTALPSTVKKPDRKNALEFKNKLEKNGINVTIRRERGSDIDGACGQLRRRHAAKSEGETDENICND